MVGAFVEAAFEVNAQRKLERAEEAILDLGRRLYALGERVDTRHQDQESLARLLEEWIDDAQHISSAERREQIVEFMAQNFLSPVTVENFDERRHFLRALDEMRDLDAAIIARVYYARLQFEADNTKSGPTIATLDVPVDRYASLAAVNRLRALGFLMPEVTGALRHDSFADRPTLTDEGLRFCELWLPRTRE